MEIKILSTSKFEINHRGHKIISDQPKEAHGTDEGMSPVEILVSSLGACVGVFISNLLARRNVPFDQCSISLDWEMANNPRRVNQIYVKLLLPEGLSEEDKTAILKAANLCTVHNTLHNSPSIEINVV